ncbi:small ribosomal subunit protein mS40 [Pelobates fuscus]|uniref:small ribosomal subunit protein mS40 n=1 Tax=Pelobates fuscus TaxID=191477 RepID=UPI002FE4D21C
MAASFGRLFVAGIKGGFGSKPPVLKLPVLVRPLTTQSDPFDAVARYKDQPWEYLISEEYLQRYGNKPVWADYRRNHKGPIPPQKTRKMCIRGGKVCGNPCPICRDQKLSVIYRNVKLLQQFLCPHTGIVLDPTKTGVCMKQQKVLIKVITEAQDHGLLPVKMPHVDLFHEDFINTHGAVSHTPAAPSGLWYSWYEWQEPPAKEVTLLKKLYRPYLKEITGGE